MDLKLLGNNWNELAEIDPMWAILMHPNRTDNRWDAAEFYQTGASDVALVMDNVRELRFPLRRGKALDFGCGLGRLTQAMACYFDEVNGVDIAPSMIQQARSYNPYGDRCRYFVNQRDDLALFGTNQFDFVFSLIVLQHMRPDYAKNYIAEFMRILAPGGLIVFQEPSHFSAKPVYENRRPLAFRARRKLAKIYRKVVHRIAPRDEARAFDFAKLSRPKYERLAPLSGADHQTTRIDGPERATPHLNGSAPRRKSSGTHTLPLTETYGIPRREMLRFLKGLGGRIIDVQQTGDCTPNWPGFRYYVTK